MADDLAFLFNDPAPAPQRGSVDRSTRPQPHTATELPAGIDWRTLREAHDETSIPVSTLRKWAKRGKVRARLVREEGRELRLVAFGDVIERARALERQVHPSQTVIDLRNPDVIEAVLETTGDEETVTGDEAIAVPAGGDAAEAVAAPDLPTHAAEGSVLVPIDAWDRILGQLGNLHEAGQQLADARERAAKAETEAEFLKERLREMRARAEQAELAVDLERRDRELPTVPAGKGSGWRRFVNRLLGDK